MTVVNPAKFHHFLAKDTKVIDGRAVSAPPPPSQADSVLKRPGEIGLSMGIHSYEVCIKYVQYRSKVYSTS